MTNFFFVLTRYLKFGGGEGGTDFKAGVCVGSGIMSSYEGFHQNLTCNTKYKEMTKSERLKFWLFSNFIVGQNWTLFSDLCSAAALPINWTLIRTLWKENCRSKRGCMAWSCVHKSSESEGAVGWAGYQQRSRTSLKASLEEEEEEFSSDHPHPEVLSHVCLCSFRTSTSLCCHCTYMWGKSTDGMGKRFFMFPR